MKKNKINAKNSQINIATLNWITSTIFKIFYFFLVNPKEE